MFHVKQGCEPKPETDRVEREFRQGADGLERDPEPMFHVEHSELKPRLASGRSFPS